MRGCERGEKREDVESNAVTCWTRGREADARAGQRARGRDGNRYIPDRYWPPISVPARTKFYPSGYPYPYTGRKIFPYPYPAGNLYPTGNPYPKSIPKNYI